MILAPGDRVDRYIVEAFVGSGGLAEVYAVRHAVLETRHALKVLKRAYPEQVRRLVREGQVQARIDHRNVVPVRDVFDVASSPALLMPLVEGPTLARVIATHRLGLHEAAALFREVVEGVRHVHDLGLIHRDLKPSNVLIELRGDALVPRVADFGLVQDAHVRLETGAFVGTPAYAAPEQLQGRDQLSPATDVWALGVLLHELLTGTLPLAESDILELARAPQQWSPAIAHDQLEPAWAGLIADLLTLDPAKRVRDGAAVAERLDALEVATAGGSPWLHLSAPLGVAVFEAMRSDHAANGAEARDRATRVAGASDDVFDPAGMATEHAGAAATEAGPRNNIPPRLDRFVGRREELALLHRALESGARILSIAGPAGAGKTRLSTEYVSENASHYPGGGWFVPLDGTTDTDGLCAAVGAVFGQQGRAGEPLEAVGRMLHERGAMLLVLDNVEQFIEPVAEAVQRWAALAPLTQFVVTSRHPLDVQGEHVLRVDPLGMPTREALGEAAELFLERARQVDARFALRGEDVADLEAIVRELDGLPLAIELAAAKVRMLSLPALRERLRRRFSLLTTRQRERGRRATLRGALDASWELLEPWEQHALLQLGVFRAPFALEDAEAVVALDRWTEAPSVMDALANLVDHSLVQVVRQPFSDDAPRYRLLVSIREYTEERWRGIEAGTDSASGMPSDRLDTERRHGQRFARWGLAPPADGVWRFGSETTAAIHQAGEDLFVACERASERGDWSIAAATGFGVARLCMGYGSMSRGVRLLSRLLQTATLTPHDRALLLTDMALLHLVTEHSGAEAAFEAAVSAAKASGDLDVASRALRGQATGAIESGRLAEAERMLDAAAALYGDAIPEAERIHTDFTRALLRIQQVRLDEAMALLTVADAYATRVGDRHFSGIVASWLHVVAMKQGRREDSRARMEHALAAALEHGHAVNHARYLRSLALLDRLDGDPKAAVERMEQAIAVQATISTLPMASFTLHAAMAALELGQVTRARGYFDRHPVPPLNPQNAAWIARARAGEALVAAHLGDAAGFDRLLELAREAQQATGIEAVESQVAAYAGLGALLLGRSDAALAHLAVARAVATRLGIHPSSVEGHELGRLERAVAAQVAPSPPVTA